MDGWMGWNQLNDEIDDNGGGPLRSVAGSVSGSGSGSESESEGMGWK